MPRREIANKLKGILREDIIKGNADHRSLCKHVEDIVETEGLEDDLKRLMCMDILRQLRDLIYIDQEKLLAFSHSLKQVEGQKHIFFFYQKRLLPMPSFLDDLDRLELKHHSKLFNIETLRRSFADSLISCHFLFITEIPQYMIDISRQISLENLGIDMEDNSAEIYSAFREIAEITGGLTDSSANAAASFKKAVNASENYYLLYYAPKNYKADGKFKTIKVRVKGKNYRITHRAGYIAD